MHCWAVRARTPSCHLLSHVREAVCFYLHLIPNCVIVNSLKALRRKTIFKKSNVPLLLSRAKKNSSDGANACDKIKSTCSFLPPGPSWRRCRPSQRNLKCSTTRWRRGPCRTLCSLWLMWKWLKGRRRCWNARWRACHTQLLPGITTAGALRTARSAKWLSVSR